MERLRNILKKITPLKFIRRIIGATIRFIKTSFEELQKVTWLSRKDTLKFTLYVLGFTLFSALAIALLDLGIYKLVTIITVRS